MAFIDRDDVPVLAHAAIAHAQFETIHPFSDGNDRTGRSLLQAQLRNKRLTRNVTVPVSAGLLTDTGAYFGAWDEYRRGDPLPIIDHVVRAAFVAIENGRQLVAELHDIRVRWEGEIRVRRGSTARRIADLLLRRPVVNAPFIAEELGIRVPNVYRALGPLIDAGVVVEATSKKRDRVWRAPDVLRALDQFAARAGRRTRPHWLRRTPLPLRTGVGIDLSLEVRGPQRRTLRTRWSEASQGSKLSSWWDWTAQV